MLCCCSCSEIFLCQVGQLRSVTMCGLETQTQANTENHLVISTTEYCQHCMFYFTCAIVCRKDGSHGPLLNIGNASVLDCWTLKTVFQLSTQRKRMSSRIHTIINIICNNICCSCYKKHTHKSVIIF